MSAGYPGQTQKVQPGLQHEMDPHPAVADNYKAAGKLKGKKLFITGGDSGIGRSVVIMMAMEGVDGITIVHREHEDKDAKNTVKEAEKHGAKVNLQAGDLGERDFCKKAIESHIKEFGTIDILVNNASEQHTCANFQDIDLDTVERTFKSNSNDLYSNNQH
jgi:NAD(P)-dependent dehydrogenase (short-subunit alcohol dehydrogenase family)